MHSPKLSRFTFNNPIALSKYLALFLMVGILHQPIFGFELNWQTINWAASDDSIQEQTFENVDGSGIDISVSLTISGVNKFGTETTISDGNLRLGANYDDVDRDINYIDVSFSFSSLVKSVSFSLQDVDKGGSGNNAYWEDVIENIEAMNNQTLVEFSSLQTGSMIAIDTITDPGDTLYRGTESDSFSAKSQLTFNWNGAINDLSFRYSGGENTRSNPSFQVVGLSNVNFMPYHAVPEPSTILSAGTICVILTVVTWKRFRSSRPKLTNPTK